MVKTGIILIDKPQGITSHDVVDVARKKLKIRRVGHSGTLDPLATGLLIILVDKATKAFKSFSDFDKEYTACLRLGIATDTADAQGRITAKMPVPGITAEKIQEVFKSVAGKIEMAAPVFSALKHKGQPLYRLARRGVKVIPKSRAVMIYSLKLDRFVSPDIEFSVKCSKGTYIRSLGEEIALRLNTIGHIVSLRRTAIGNYPVSEAKKIDNFNENDIRAC